MGKTVKNTWQNHKLAEYYKYYLDTDGHTDENITKVESWAKSSQLPDLPKNRSGRTCFVEGYEPVGDYLHRENKKSFEKGAIALKAVNDWVKSGKEVTQFPVPQ